MSRLTVKNIVKVALTVMFFPFLAFLLLIVGLGAKKKKLILEGALYCGIFLIAVALPGGSGAFVGLAAMGFSAVRSYMFRDLWLPRRTRKSKRGEIIQEFAPTIPVAQPVPSTASFAGSSDELAVALTWVSVQAKANKHRLPADTYVTILETCQLLDSVIDAEIRQPSADARFEYELEAMVREYLPSVIRGYLSIPPSMVESRQPNGKTPNEELVEQLRLLLGQAETLHSTRHSQTSADLTSTGNFLRERFGHHQQGGFDFGID